MRSRSRRGCRQEAANGHTADSERQPDLPHRRGEVPATLAERARPRPLDDSTIQGANFPISDAFLTFDLMRVPKQFLAQPSAEHRVGHGRLSLYHAEVLTVCGHWYGLKDRFSLTGSGLRARPNRDLVPSAQSAPLYFYR
jgi:hypothetical protein